MARVALYLRVSTNEQKISGISIESQKDALIKYAEANNHTIVDIYNDAGHSAHASYKTRSELLRLLSDISAHKIDMVLITRLDRWFRNISDYHRVQEILEANNVTWKAIWEDYDTCTAAGRLKINIVESVAQHEADIDSERIKSVKAFQRENGKWNGGPAPIGYKLVNTQLVKDPDQEWVVFFFETYLRTFSLYATVSAVNQKYNVKIPQSSQYRLLHKPVYYGLASGYHQCEGYITKEQYDIIQEHTGKHPRHSRATDYIFTGIAWCPSCNARMRSTSHFVKGVRYEYYSCDGRVRGAVHPSISVSEKKLEKYLLNNIEKLVADHNETVATAEPSRKISHDKQRKNLEAKLERVKVLFEEGDLEISEYKQKRDSIKQQLADIQVEEKQQPIVLDKEWKEAYALLDKKHKHQVWSRIVDKIIVQKGEKPNIIFY